MTLDVQVHERGSGHIIELKGEADSSNVEALRLALAKAQEGEGPVVVDLREVTFVDSSVLAALLNAQRRMTRAGRRLSLIVVPGAVARLLEVTRLDTTFALADTPTEALDLP